MRTYRITSHLLVFLSLVLVIGCAPGGVKREISKSYFQEENEPVRTLRVVVVTTGNGERGARTIRNASDLIEPQVGIRLSIVKTIVVKQGFASWDRDNALTKLYTVTTDAGLEHGKDFDIAVGMSYTSPLGYAAKVAPIPMWYGVIDDNLCRCFYVTKTTGRRINAHEFMHAFIFQNEHRGGLMAGIEIYVVPGIFPIIGGGKYLLQEDREEVLKNKWRDVGNFTTEQRKHIKVVDRIHVPQT